MNEGMYVFLSRAESYMKGKDQGFQEGWESAIAMMGTLMDRELLVKHGFTVKKVKKLLLKA
jgi:hypothetical protein